MKIDVRPQAGGQWESLEHLVFEMLFGGQAGPGKSWSLVINALGLQFEKTPLGMPAVHVPSYRAVLFRRKTTQFTKLIDEGKKYYTAEPLNAEFIQSRRGDPGPSFNFPTSKEVSGRYYTGSVYGARIFVCHMEMEQNKEDHQGQEYQFVGFDELTQFTLTQYLYLFSRARSTVKHLIPRVNSTTNPTGSGLIWVKKRFIKNGGFVLEPKKVYYFKSDNTVSNPIDNPTGVETTADDPDGKARIFIPGDIYENKILLDADPGYIANIKAMGSKMERALLKGDWDAFGGDFFDDLDTSPEGGHGVKPFEIPTDWALEASMDPGWSAPLSFGMQARSHEGKIYRLFTYYVRERSASQHAESILDMIKNFPWTGGRMPSKIVSGHDAWQRKERYTSSPNDLTMAQIFANFGLYLSRANTSRVNGWWAWKEAIRGFLWYYFQGYNGPLIDEMVAAEHDERNPEDLKGGGNDPDVSDHALDDCRYGTKSIYVPRKSEPEPEKQEPPFGIVVEEETDVRNLW
jgi:Terminase large subunit, T4likevirus-type, N-terminal